MAAHHHHHHHHAWQGPGPRGRRGCSPPAGASASAPTPAWPSRCPGRRPGGEPGPSAGPLRAAAGRAVRGLRGPRAPERPRAQTQAAAAAPGAGEAGDAAGGREKKRVAVSVVAVAPVGRGGPRLVRDSARCFWASVASVVARAGPGGLTGGLTGDARGRQVFVSGGGSNLKALHRAMESGRVHGELALVVSDKPGCGGWAYAEGLGVPVAAFPAGGGGDAGALDAAGLVALLREELRVDLVVLAG